MLTEEHTCLLKLHADAVKQAEVAVFLVDRHDESTDSLVERVFWVLISPPIWIISTLSNSLQRIVWRKDHIFYHNGALVWHCRVGLGRLHRTFVFLCRFTSVLIRRGNHCKRARNEIKSVDPILVLHALDDFKTLWLDRLAFCQFCLNLLKFWAFGLPNEVVFELEKLEAHSGSKL